MLGWKSKLLKTDAPLLNAFESKTATEPHKSIAAKNAVQLTSSHATIEPEAISK